MNSLPARPRIAQERDVLLPADLPGRWMSVARVAWIAAGLFVVGLYISSIPARYDQVISLTNLPPAIDAAVLRANLDAAGLSLELYALHKVAMEVAFALVCVSLGILIFWRRSTERMALFTALLLVLLGTTFWGTIQALSVSYPSLRPVLLFLDALGLMLLFVALFLFPDGRFVPKWTVWPTAFLISGVTISALFPELPLNPANFSAPAFLLFVLAWLVLGIGSQIYRYKRVSQPVQRQQTKWVVFGIAAAVTGFVLIIFVGEIHLSVGAPGTPGEMVAASVMTVVMLLIPASISIAILRHRLFEIDSLINRALVYGALTATVIALYVLIVGYLGALVQAGSSLLISLVATGVVAVAFSPLREYFQRVVNQLMYGDRDDPYKALNRLGARLEEAFAPDAVLPTIVETVRDALKLPYVAISLDNGSDSSPEAKSGESKGEPLRLPLMYQNEQVGELLVARRHGEEEFTRADHQLLDDLSRQAGVAVHAVRLTADLQRSRQHLVTAREEERRRLRRDLHDGVGPRLAALVMKLETARAEISHDPGIDSVLSDVAQLARDAVGDIRRAVHALRPPALDELGLVAALRESAARYSQGELLISIEVEDELPPLPAAVEVAAYLIVQEAMTNVVRHSRASDCVVRFAVVQTGQALQLTVEDNGRGIRSGRAFGVGLSSMRDRAEELGGRFTTEPRAEGGTRVEAVLPYQTVTPAETGEASRWN